VAFPGLVRRSKRKNGPVRMAPAQNKANVMGLGRNRHAQSHGLHFIQGEAEFLFEVGLGRNAGLPVGNDGVGDDAHRFPIAVVLAPVDVLEPRDFRFPARIALPGRV